MSFTIDKHFVEGPNVAIGGGANLGLEFLGYVCTQWLILLYMVPPTCS
jgi:hypothetical protein